LFEDGTGPGLEPVGGEFQPSIETAYPGGDPTLFRTNLIRHEKKSRSKRRQQSRSASRWTCTWSRVTGF